MRWRGLRLRHQALHDTVQLAGRAFEWQLLVYLFGVVWGSANRFSGCLVDAVNAAETNCTRQAVVIASVHVLSFVVLCRVFQWVAVEVGETRG